MKYALKWTATVQAAVRVRACVRHCTKVNSKRMAVVRVYQGKQGENDTNDTQHNENSKSSSFILGPTHTQRTQRSHSNR